MHLVPNTVMEIPLLLNVGITDKKEAVSLIWGRRSRSVTADRDPTPEMDEMETVLASSARFREKLAKQPIMPVHSGVKITPLTITVKTKKTDERYARQVLQEGCGDGFRPEGQSARDVRVAVGAFKQQKPQETECNGRLTKKKNCWFTS